MDSLLLSGLASTTLCLWFKGNLDQGVAPENTLLPGVLVQVHRVPQSLTHRHIIGDSFETRV